MLEFIESALDSSAVDIPMKARTHIAIASEEIFVNIANYAYPPYDGNVVVRVSVGDGVAVEFTDYGAEYDPTAKTDPDITLPAGERDVGGLGIFMVKKFMDSVTYRRDGDKNILLIKKNIA
jgi:anti-sigma regulatory factor (Ser/Thr protein kinase)